MARQAKPWFRRGWWLTKINGQPIKLAKGRESFPEAEKKFFQLKAAQVTGQPPPEPASAAGGISFEVLIARYLAFLDGQGKTPSAEQYGFLFRSLIDVCGQLPPAAVKVDHIDQWIAGRRRKKNRPWGDTTVHKALTAAQALFNWAVKRGHVPSNILLGYEKPASRQREWTYSPELAQKVVGAIKDDEFRHFLVAVAATGLRPGMVAAVTAHHFDKDTGAWVFKNHKGIKKTGKIVRKVLSPELAALTNEMIQKHPTGVLFRNRRGNPWRKDAWVRRLARLRAKLKLPKDAIMYALRHTYGTVMAMTPGENAHTIKAAMGHATLGMAQNYVHLAEQGELLKRQASVVSSALGISLQAPDRPAEGPRPEPEEGKRPA
jgi:integrase